MLLPPRGALRPLHTLPNNNSLLLRHSGVLTLGWHIALPSLAPQTAHAAREKAVVSDLSSAAERLHPPSPRVAASLPPTQVPGRLLHHLSGPQMSVRELPSDLGAKKRHRGLPRAEQVSEPAPSVAHLLRALAQPLAPAHPHRALFNASLRGTRQRSSVTPVSQGETLRQREEVVLTACLWQSKN